MKSCIAHAQRLFNIVANCQFSFTIKSLSDLPVTERASVQLKMIWKIIQDRFAKLMFLQMTAEQTGMKIAYTMTLLVSSICISLSYIFQFKFQISLLFFVLELGSSLIPSYFCVAHLAGQRKLVFIYLFIFSFPYPFPARNSGSFHQFIKLFDCINYVETRNETQ